MRNILVRPGRAITAPCSCPSRVLIIGRGATEFLTAFASSSIPVETRHRGGHRGDFQGLGGKELPCDFCPAKLKQRPGLAPHCSSGPAEILS
eukprot:s41_g6.t1